MPTVTIQFPHEHFVVPHGQTLTVNGVATGSASGSSGPTSPCSHQRRRTVRAVARALMNARQVGTPN
jgi:hypothetical protein